jgi:pimeloyl-ACP methyl ester carboxylesterase
MRALLLTVLLSLTTLAEAQTQPAQLRYHLTAGDRLAYREVFEQSGKSQDTSFRSRSTFSTQLVVLDSSAGRTLAGVQRNRESGELLEYLDHGKDALALQLPAFKQRMTSRPQRLADSNVFSAAGQPLLPLQVLREAGSKLLYRVSEIMPLPATAVQPSSEWDEAVVGLRLRLDRYESVGDESCAVIVDNGSRKDAHLQFTFCPRSGHLARLDFTGQYREFESTIEEHVTLDLQSATSGESPDFWLNRADTRMAALEAYLAALLPLPASPVMNDILQNGTHDAQALALAVYYQRGATPPAPALAGLQKSTGEEVRRIAEAFSQTPPKPASQPCDVPPTHYQRQKPGTTLRGMNSTAFPGAPYMMQVPLDYRGDQPFPLVIYLSGGGGLAFDAALNLSDSLKQSSYLVLMPHAGGRLWWETQTTEMVHALLLEVFRNFNVDANRVYLAGFSNGGTGAIEYGVRWPDRFAAIASLMGAGLDTPSGSKLPLQNLAGVPLLLLHGDKDPLIPQYSSYRTYTALRDLKPRVSPVMHVLKGRVHDITLSSDDDFTLPFLDKNVREPFPAAVTATFFDPAYPRQYWVEVVEGDKNSASVEARILEGNLIDIDTKHVKKLRLLLRPELFPTSEPIRIRLNGKEHPPISLTRDCKVFQQSLMQSEDPFLAYTDEISLEVPN